MKVTIIGAGNMGGAIARALAGLSGLKSSDITCTARSEGTLEKYAQAGFCTTTDNHIAVKGADLVVFAVKPWFMEEVMRDVTPHMDLERTIVASVAAGISFQQMSSWLGGSPAMFSIIPNTAIEVGAGVTFISSCNATEHQRGLISDMFSHMGYALEIEEDKMAAGTALASCGIAYAMKYIQASADAGESLGFSAEQAGKIVEYTVKGAASLLLSTGNPPQVEIDKVTTPGGMTMKGLAAMEEAGFAQAVAAGVNGCLK